MLFIPHEANTARLSRTRASAKMREPTEGMPAFRTVEEIEAAMLGTSPSALRSASSSEGISPGVLYMARVDRPF